MNPESEVALMAGRLGGLVRGLRSPELGLLGQGLRFALAGGVVAAVYVLSTLIFSHVLGLPFEAALALGFTLALATHFTMQRLFVWVHHTEFALPIQHQAGRYLAITFTQYGITAATTAVLPRALHMTTDIVYFTVTALITVANFLLFRTHVFHAEEGAALQKP